MVHHAKDNDSQRLPSRAFLASSTQCLVRVWEKLEMKQDSTATESGEAKPMADVTFKSTPLKCPTLHYLKIRDLQDIGWNLRKAPFKQEWE